MKHNNDCCLLKIICAVISILVIIFFVGYSCFLMYKTGFKGQVSFFSDVFGIILTTSLSVFITLHFTGKKLRADRQSSIKGLLYIEDHKFIIKTVSKILYLTSDANGIDIKTEAIVNKTTKFSKKTNKKWIGDHSQHLISEYNKLGTYNLHFLKLTHKSIVGICDKFYRQLVAFGKYYNNKFMKKANRRTIVSMNEKIQNVNTTIRLIAKKLTQIDKTKRSKIE